LNDDRLHLNSFYIPIKIVDETVCLLINADTTPIAQLLGRKKTQLFLSLVVVLLATIGVGSGLAFTIVSPLKKLQKRSLAAVKEFTNTDVAPDRWGNEIDTLSRAADLMLSAIKSHLADLHRAQDVLRMEKLFLDNIFSSIQDGLCVLDMNDTILRVNRVYEERFGNQRLVGEKCYQAIYGHMEPCENCPCRQAREAGRVSYQTKLVSRGDAEFWIEIYAFPLRDQETGELTGTIEYSRDITELKTAENTLQLREEQLRQAAKMEAVGRLAGGVAHDFNNILTVIIGECELLLQELPGKDPLVDGVTGILEATRRASSLTQHLLAFSRKQVLQPQPLDLNSAVTNLHRMLQRILGEDITLATNLVPDLGTVMVDSNQLEQVVLNLATNARDAMPQGGTLAIETANVDLDEDYAQKHVDAVAGAYVRLTISDTGVGVDKDAMVHIFEPFFTTKEPGRGTGLGLSMVYGIVKQSQGHITVYSEVGHGTTFKIYLPRCDQPLPDLTEPPPLPTVAAGGTATILLVEDEASVRDVVSRMLEQVGYRILAAADPEEALYFSREHQGPIHLLFTDVVMPGMSGRQLANLILAQRPGLKVLFMSGYTEDAIFHHGVLDLGISFINKPFKYDSLVKKVREVLDAWDPSRTENFLENRFSSGNTDPLIFREIPQTPC
jgi:PAS domain S-box-containing protein